LLPLRFGPAFILQFFVKPGKACGKHQVRVILTAKIQIIPKPFMKIAALLIWNIALVELSLERLTEGCGIG
jgi:hypothetical protein